MRRLCKCETSFTYDEHCRLYSGTNVVTHHQERLGSPSELLLLYLSLGSLVSTNIACDTVPEFVGYRSESIR